MNRQFRFPMWVVALGGALVSAGCSRSGAEAAAPGADVPTVAVAQIARGDVAQTLTVAAEFRPFQEIDVHAKVAGYLKTITVDVGDRVKAGQLLAVLEIPELQDDLQEDQAAINHAQEEVNRAQADLQRTESAHDVAHLAATRLDAVIKARPNLVAQQDVDDANGRDRVAEAQVSTAKAAVAAAEQQLAVSKAGEAKTRTLFAYTQITAPFTGVITRRYADTGAMIQAGTSSQTQALPIVRLSENSVLRLAIPVPESAVPQVRIGEPVDVSVPVLGKTFPGTISRFADKLDEQTRTMHTEVDVKNPELLLVPGMYASATLTLSAKKNVVTVPVEAVDRNGDKASVDVIDKDRRVQTRPIALGIDTPNRIEVVSGLQPGDLVVLGNRSQLKPGAQVTPKVEAAARQD